MAILDLSRRQIINGDNSPLLTDDGWVWYAVKWVIIAAIFLLFMIFVVGGYYHAKRRMRKGLPLLAYHRWLVPRRTRAQYSARFNPQQNNYAYYNSYPMHPYGGPPPPAYNPETDYVPPYAPPEGSSKVNPSQQTAVRTQEVGVVRHVPPPGPPPGRMLGGGLGEGSGLRQPTRVASPAGK